MISLILMQYIVDKKAIKHRNPSSTQNNLNMTTKLVKMKKAFHFPLNALQYSLLQKVINIFQISPFQIKILISK